MIGRRRAQAGVVSVEFAMLAGLLVLLLIGTLSAGVLVLSQTALQEALSIGTPICGPACPAAAVSGGHHGRGCHGCPGRKLQWRDGPVHDGHDHLRILERLVSVCPERRAAYRRGLLPVPQLKAGPGRPGLISVIGGCPFGTGLGPQSAPCSGH
jgi:Flp pilus assembly pilin Flp